MALTRFCGFSLYTGGKIIAIFLLLNALWDLLSGLNIYDEENFSKKMYLDSSSNQNNNTNNTNEIIYIVSRVGSVFDLISGIMLLIGIVWVNKSLFFNTY